MSKPLETHFKRIETKYVVLKDQFTSLLYDLQDFMTEDDFPISNISNIYFDTPDFDVIRDALDYKNQREKIRMRTYLTNPTESSQVFLEIKFQDDEGIGHKARLIDRPSSIVNYLTTGEGLHNHTDKQLVDHITTLRERYPSIKPKMFISYDRYSLKEKKHTDGTVFNKIRITFDQNLAYRETKVNLFSGRHGQPLLDADYMIMEIKAPGIKPEWLQDILDKHGLVQVRFSKYSASYHKSQGIDYMPVPTYMTKGEAN